MATSGTFSINWESGIWATSGNTKTYHLSGSWSKSGNTITISSMSLYATMLYASYGQDDDTFILQANGSQILSQSRTLTANGGTSSSIFYPNNASFNVTSTATSATLRAGHSGESYWGTTTINFDATYVAPTTPTVSASPSSDTTISIVYGTTSFGNPSTGTVYLYGGTNSTPTTQLASATSTGDQTVTHTNLNANTTYYYRSRASNGQLWSNYSSTVSAVTLPAEITMSVSSVAENNVVISYSAPADGGVYTKTLEYSTDGGTTWATGATISGGTATSGSFTISGLVPGTSYTIKSRVVTTAGATDNPDITIKTKAPLYGSVNGQTKQIEKLYGSVGGVTKQITKLYGSVNGVTKRIY